MTTWIVVLGKTVGPNPWPVGNRAGISQGHLSLGDASPEEGDLPHPTHGSGLDFCKEKKNPLYFCLARNILWPPGQRSRSLLRRLPSSRMLNLQIQPVKSWSAWSTWVSRCSQGDTRRTDSRFGQMCQATKIHCNLCETHKCPSDLLGVRQNRRKKLWAFQSAYPCFMSWKQEALQH